MKTGIAKLDEILGEIRSGELVLVAGRIGMGKTTLFGQIIANNCMEKKCAYLSALEDNFEICAQVECALGNMTLAEYIKKEKTKEVEEVYKATQEIISKKLNEGLYFYFGKKRFLDVCIQLAKLKAEKGLDFVCLDNFELMEKNIPMPVLAQGLKLLAEELDIVIFAGCCPKRTGNIPNYYAISVNEHLKYYADKIIAVHRKEVFATIKDFEEKRFKKGESLLCVAKNNGGETGVATVYFNYQRCGFFDSPIQNDE